MPQAPNPIPCGEGQGTRRLWCVAYDDCLSHAACAAWYGFDCSKCDDAVDISDEEKIVIMYDELRAVKFMAMITRHWDGKSGLWAGKVSRQYMGVT